MMFIFVVVGDVGDHALPINFTIVGNVCYGEYPDHCVLFHFSVMSTPILDLFQGNSIDQELNL